MSSHHFWRWSVGTVQLFSAATGETLGHRLGVLFVSLCESYGGLCGGSLWPFPNGEVTGQLVDL